MKKTKYWYVKTRGSYLPASFEGWLSYIPFIAYLVSSIYFSDRISKDHSLLVSIVFVLIPDLIAATAIMTAIARRKSARSKR